MVHTKQQVEDDVVGEQTMLVNQGYLERQSPRHVERASNSVRRSLEDNVL